MPQPELRICLADDDLDASLRLDARRGLTSRPKHLPMRLHYDGRGSGLFGKLTEQPEYYQTRSERAILRDRAREIAAALGAEPVSVIELGAGRAEKIRPVLDALAAAGRLDAFWPFDVAEGEVRDVLAELATAYPDAHLGGIVGDFTRHLAHLPDHRDTRLVAFLGGTFGNLPGPERARFLLDLREALRPGDRFLLGADLVKDPRVILAAYNDAAGVTAEFNRNVLHVLNHRLDADFEPGNFEHVVTWDAPAATVDMRLRAMKPMEVDVAGLGLEVRFAVGEEIHTGISVKFRPAELEEDLRTAGFAPSASWTDARANMGVFLAEAV
ncbi:L-histidine N(alpha)-methyltransferase [Glycomyces terrestris]|uniref:L-histidine N(Alpha)-methyltransferase n=1 Tax=Glycomyces terrestris TaxID=2493553 RepID=A0A426UU80_9ACTN|nr:L-histidine N(alpha)-methyltransferase [Glycomyces terrestris]RRR97554.1 L-histidine N(alpha)-methyltransferase [Glycomyces terrestris]